MLLQDLELINFRNYRELRIDFAPGVNVFVGANGQGKTNLLEAVGYLATLASFRGASNETLVRSGASSAIVRANGERAGKPLLIESEIHVSGRNRTLLNRQPLRRSRDLLGALRVTVFSPDDLDLVKGAPAGRRRFLDDLATAVNPSVDHVRVEFERVLRQRNALLKQARGRLTSEIISTLDVWDMKLTQAGEALAQTRRELVANLDPLFRETYASLSGDRRLATMRYAPLWHEAGLLSALNAARDDDVRRGVSTVGPHRDELSISLGNEPARTHASQGEQRSVVLSLRLSGHRLVHEATGAPPVLLLDDVLSELDESRRSALLAHLPHGQTLVTTAADVPRHVSADQVFRVAGGTIAVPNSNDIDGI